MVGFANVADAMEMMILSILAPALHCHWHISEVQQATLTTVVFLGERNFFLSLSFCVKRILFNLMTFLCLRNDDRLPVLGLVDRPLRAPVASHLGLPLPFLLWPPLLIRTLIQVATVPPLPRGLLHRMRASGKQLF